MMSLTSWYLNISFNNKLSFALTISMKQSLKWKKASIIFIIKTQINAIVFTKI